MYVPNYRAIIDDESERARNTERLEREERRVEERNADRRRELFRKGRNGPRAEEKARMPFHYRKLVRSSGGQRSCERHARNGYVQFVLNRRILAVRILIR